MGDTLKWESCEIRGIGRSSKKAIPRRVEEEVEGGEGGIERGFYIKLER